MRTLLRRLAQCLNATPNCCGEPMVQDGPTSWHCDECQASYQTG